MYKSQIIEENFEKERKSVLFSSVVAWWWSDFYSTEKFLQWRYNIDLAFCNILEGLQNQ